VLVPSETPLFTALVAHVSILACDVAVAVNGTTANSPRQSVIANDKDKIRFFILDALLLFCVVNSSHVKPQA